MANSDRQCMPLGTSKSAMIKKDFIKNKYIYMMFIPVFLYYLIFHYLPMYGAQIAFKDYRPGIDIWEAEWIGFKYFIEFFDSYYFFRTVRNTVLLNVYSLIFGFPVPIILALSFNEIKKTWFKRTAQTLTYLPYFVSTVIICGIITDFTSTHGVIYNIARHLGYREEVSLLLKPEYFRTIYVTSGIWQGAGWSSIIYLSALSSINPELYEAAKIDGANRWQQMIHITLASLAPTITIMLILQLGNIMNVGFEKVFLLYRPATYETSDVISTYVYRKGLNEAQFGFSAAVGIFNSIINMTILYISNLISRKTTGNSLF